jgi:hypothetical protein
MPQTEITNMALFCDFENIALGVRDAKYEKFDIGKVLERLLLKGSIVVKKAYCDWERYKAFKAPMHEASFELIEIPHVRQSGKNSADIRMVVDALDLCYTKSHVETFVDHQRRLRFLAARLEAARERQDVIGVGVQELDVRPADRELRRVHLLRRPRARAKKRPAARKSAAKSPSDPKGKTKGARNRRAPRPKRARRTRSATARSLEQIVEKPSEAGGGHHRRTRRRREIWVSMVKPCSSASSKPGSQRIVLRVPHVQRNAEKVAQREGRFTSKRRKIRGYIVQLSNALE